MTRSTSAPTTRPPRRRLSAEARRGQIMDATVRVVADGGYAAASAEAIATEAGLSKGLLWHYFGNQDALLEATARRTAGSLYAAVGERIDLEAPVPELITAAIRAAVGLRETHAPERRALAEIVQNLRRDDGSLLFTMSDAAEARSAQEAIFARGQAEGTVRPDLDAGLLAVTYQATVEGLLDHLDEQAGALSDAAVDAAVDQVVRTLLGGLAVDRPA